MNLSVSILGKTHINSHEAKCANPYDKAAGRMAKEHCGSCPLGWGIWGHLPTY